MSNYVKDAKTEADSYAKRRKQQALEVIENINAEAAAEKQAAQADTAAKVGAEQRTALDAWDTAAVQKQVEMQAIREAMAGWGLTASGAERASLGGAAAAAARRSSAVRRSRDDAVAALTAALRRTEQDIEGQRLADVTAEKQAADADADANRTKLLDAAYDAEAKEEAARIKAEEDARRDEIARQEQILKWKRDDAAKITAAVEKEAEEKRKAEEKRQAEAQKAKEKAEAEAKKKQEKAEAEAKKKQEKAEAEAKKQAEKEAAKKQQAQEKAVEEQKKADKQQEANRRSALRALNDDKTINGTVYSLALTNGWSPEKAIAYQNQLLEWNKVLKKAKTVAKTKGKDVAIAYAAKYDLSEEYQRRLASVLGMDYPTVKQWIIGYQNMKHGSDKVKELDEKW